MASLARSPLDTLPTPSSSRQRSALAEWPTWVVWIGIYGGFGVLTYFWQSVPVWIAVPLLGYLICWNGHLMHEVLHGHPTRSRQINRLLVLPNLTFYIPYEIYRDIHIAHHGVETLGHPVEDPESFYVLPEKWDSLPGWRRALLRANNSLIGRMVIGPWLMVGGFWRSEIRRYASGDRTYIGAWLILLASNAAVAYWVFALCDIPVLEAAIAVYLGFALMTVRSFTEHRPAANQEARCAIVEAGPLMRLLFLNNNFHLVHHALPNLSWHEIPKAYFSDREGWIARTEGHWFKGYWDVLRQTGLTPKDSPRFPG